MQCCGSEVMYSSDPDPAFPVNSDPDPTTRPSNYMENFRCASWDCIKTYLKDFKSKYIHCTYVSQTHYTILMYKFAKLIQIFCHKGRIRFGIWVRNDFFGSGSVSELAKKVPHPTGSGAGSTTQQKLGTIKIDEDFTRYYLLKDVLLDIIRHRISHKRMNKRLKYC